jgi:tRNA-dihydrouridine synthase
MNFLWQNLPRPFYVLAPMEGATDAPFRQVVQKCGKPEVMFTEFVNVEGLASPKGSQILERMLIFEPQEQPLVAQIWGLKPANFELIAARLVERGFAGVDINMGCPDRSVIGKGTGGALVNNPELAAQIIAAVKKGVAGRVPVSVKIRIGFKEIVTEAWAGFILEQGVDALTVHGRTVKELSLVPTHWDEIGKVAVLRDRMQVPTVIVGNGDVESLAEAKARAAEFGVDGVMIGRGVFKNPWVFNREKSGLYGEALADREERIRLLRWHVGNYQRLLGAEARFDPLKRFFKIYIQSFAGAGELREELMSCKSFEDFFSLMGSGDPAAAGRDPGIAEPSVGG